MRPESPSATEEPRAWPASKRVRMGPVSKPPAASSRILSGSIEIQSGVVFPERRIGEPLQRRRTPLHCRNSQRSLFRASRLRDVNASNGLRAIAAVFECVRQLPEDLRNLSCKLIDRHVIHPRGLAIRRNLLERRREIPVGPEIEASQGVGLSHLSTTPTRP